MQEFNKVEAFQLHYSRQTILEALQSLVLILDGKINKCLSQLGTKECDAVMMKIANNGKILDRIVIVCEKLLMPDLFSVQLALGATCSRYALCTSCPVFRQTFDI